MSEIDDEMAKNSKWSKDKAKEGRSFHRSGYIRSWKWSRDKNYMSWELGIRFYTRQKCYVSISIGHYVFTLWYRG